MTAEEVAAKSIPKPVGRPKKVLTEAEIVASLVVKPKGRPRNLMEELEDSAVESLKEKSEKAKGGKKEERAIGEKRRVGRPAYTEEQREAADARKAAVEAEAQRLRDVEAEKERLRKEKVAQRLEAEWVEAARLHPDKFPRMPSIPVTSVNASSLKQITISDTFAQSQNTVASQTTSATSQPTATPLPLEIPSAGLRQNHPFIKIEFVTPSLDSAQVISGSGGGKC